MPILKYKYSKAPKARSSTASNFSLNSNIVSSNRINTSTMRDPKFSNKHQIESPSDHVKRKEDLRAQLNYIIQAKKQLSVQIEHWERIKRITKDPKELADIENKLYKLRSDFLAFGNKYF